MIRNGLSTLVLCWCMAAAGAARAAEFPVDGAYIVVEGMTRSSVLSMEQTVNGNLIMSETYPPSGGVMSMSLSVFNKRQMLTWKAIAVSCQMNNNYSDVAVIYQSGKSHGTATCDGRTTGTDTDSTTYSPITAEYDGEATVAGDEIRLSGTMTIHYVRDNVTKGGMTPGTAHYDTTLLVQQSAIISVRGKACDVKALSWVERETETGELNLEGGVVSQTHQVREETFSLTDQSRCRIQ